MKTPRTDALIESAKAHYMAVTLCRTLETELNNLQTKVDMWRDEFQRIKAIEFSKLDVIESEIAGICDRAMTDIFSTVPIIDERDRLLASNDKFRSALWHYNTADFITTQQQEVARKALEP